MHQEPEAALQEEEEGEEEGEGEGKQTGVIIEENTFALFLQDAASLSGTERRNREAISSVTSLPKNSPGFPP